MSSMRMLRWALAVSVCIHLALLLAGRGYWLSLLEDEAPEETLDVRLVAPPAPMPSPPPPKPKPRPKPPQVSAADSATRAVPASAVAPDAPPLASAATGGRSSTGAGASDPLGGDGAVPARALPGSGRLRFDVLKGEQGFIVGRAEHDWRIDGDRYTLTSTMETTGIVALFADVQLGQLSVGRIDAEGLHPDAFQDNRKDGRYRSVFDWERGTLTLSNGKVMPLGPGAQDLLSMFYQFALYPLDTPELALMVTTGRKFERYVFRIERDVELWLNRATDDAPIWTYHLSYRGREAEGVDVWLARDKARLPVKIRYTDRKGGVTEMVAQEVEYSGNQVSGDGAARISRENK